MMHRIKIDKEKNRLTLSLSGFIDLKSAMDIVYELEVSVAPLKSDYDIIVDIRHFRPTNIYVLNQIKIGKSMFQTTGARYAIFAVGSSKYALTMFAKFANHKDSDIFFVPTVDIAREKLSKLVENDATVCVN